MPPTTKPQTKKKEAEEGREKVKAVKAKKVVAAALLLLLVAAFVAAQNQQTGNQAGNMPDADKALSGFKQIGKWIVIGVRSAIAIAFWVAIAIVITHFALGKVAPTRFQRMGSFWDGLERAKDIIYGYAWLFLLIFAIYAAIGVIVHGGEMKVNDFMNVVRWMMVQPIEDLFNEIQRDSGQGGQRTGP